MHKHFDGAIVVPLSLLRHFLLVLRQLIVQSGRNSHFTELFLPIRSFWPNKSDILKGCPTGTEQSLPWQQRKRPSRLGGEAAGEDAWCSPSGQPHKHWPVCVREQNHSWGVLRELEVVARCENMRGIPMTVRAWRRVHSLLLSADQRGQKEGYNSFFLSFKSVLIEV